MDPGSLYNVIHNNSDFFLRLFNKLGLQTITSASKPFTKWLQKQMDAANPDEDGYFLER